MRAATSLRLLLVPAVVLASACDDSSNPLAPEAPPVAEAEAPGPERTAGPLEDLAYWADGYLWAVTVPGTVTRFVSRRSSAASPVAAWYRRLNGSEAFAFDPLSKMFASRHLPEDGGAWLPRRTRGVMPLTAGPARRPVAWTRLSEEVACGFT